MAGIRKGERKNRLEFDGFTHVSLFQEYIVFSQVSTQRQTSQKRDVF